MAHPSIGRAIVVGLKDAHYGEVVGAFVERQAGPDHEGNPGDDEVREWVRAVLGKHKSPTHVLWLGEGGVPADVPLTGSGKVRKFEMANLGNEILARRRKGSEGLSKL